MSGLGPVRESRRGSGEFGWNEFGDVLEARPSPEVVIRCAELPTRSSGTALPERITNPRGRGRWNLRAPYRAAPSDRLGYGRGSRSRTRYERACQNFRSSRRDARLRLALRHQGCVHRLNRGHQGLHPEEHRAENLVDAVQGGLFVDIAGRTCSRGERGRVLRPRSPVASHLGRVDRSFEVTMPHERGHEIRQGVGGARVRPDEDTGVGVP